jgi:hypothetical protein
MRSALEIKHFTRRTKETYVYWITRYHTFLRNPQNLDALPSSQKVEAFLSNLTPNVAAAAQNQTFYTLLFFYRNVIGTELGDIHALHEKKKVRVPVVLSKPK